MQNIVIIGAVVIVAVVGFILLQTNSAPEAVVDEVVVVETEDTTTNEMAEETVSNDIVETAIATPELSTLVAAVVAADLVTTLQSEGPFTVFAPLNEAFEALPAGTLETLLMAENQADLQGILTYHVVPGKVMSGDLVDGMVVETVNGGTITINVSDAGVTINGGATVAIADIETSNGVVHVIDAVLLPSAE